jgi:hypothetical protein
MARASSRRCLAVLFAVAVAALLFSACCAEGAAAAGGKATPQRRQLLRQRHVEYHLRRLNKPPVASIEVHPSIHARLVSLLPQLS